MKAVIQKSEEGRPLNLIIEAEDEAEDKILVEIYAGGPSFRSIGSVAQNPRVQIVMPIP